MNSKEIAEKVASDIATKYNVKTVVIQGVRGINGRRHDHFVDDTNMIGRSS